MKVYKAGLYARLSSDQDLKKNESLETQIKIGENYVEDWNQRHKDKIVIVGRYRDLGKTGTNFDRDAFKQLMDDVRLGNINCVIVKDLSRFGRNYLEAGNYIEKIFPFLGVRFIAVAEGYDTGENGSNTRQMAVEIKNLVNDMYAKDFSARAKVSLKQRRDMGSYVGGPPPYGYEAYQEGRVRRLKPDRNAAEIVSQIYEKFLDTKSYQAVADYLNERRINPPAVYKKTRKTCCLAEMKYTGWNKGAVERILKSQTYTGHLVQGEPLIPTHEAIISWELYEQAGEIRRVIRERTQGRGHPGDGCPIGENIFDKVLYCGVCSRKMTRHSCVKKYADGWRERRDHYFCVNSTGAGTEMEMCPDPNRISKNKLAEFLCFLFRTEFAVRLKMEKSYVDQGRALIRRKKRELDQGPRMAEGQIAALWEEEGEKYMAYRGGSLSWEEYVHCRLWRDERLGELEKQKSRYQEEVEKLERKEAVWLKTLCSLTKLKSGKDLTKELVEALVEKIYVYPGKRAEIVLAYSDIWMEGAKQNGGETEDSHLSEGIRGGFSRESGIQGVEGKPQHQPSEGVSSGIYQE